MLREETLRYLRYTDQVLSDEQNALIDTAIAEVLEYAAPRTVHRVFALHEKDGLLGIDAELDLHYTDIQKLLTGSSSCLLIAGTLGVPLDQKMRYYSRFDMTRYVIMDAAASALIEETCDTLQESLPFSPYTFRFSPGYGDVPLSLQKQLLQVLDAGRRIGLTLTPNMLMTPQKSISGIVGIGKGSQSGELNQVSNGTRDDKEHDTRNENGLSIESQKRTCNNCRRYNDCEYRRNNTVCYQIK